MSALIGRIYAGVHDSRSFVAGIDGLLSRIGARVALVAATGPDDTGLIDMRLHGATEARHGDLMNEYHGAGLWQADPTFRFLSQYPGARFFDTALHRPRAVHLADPYVTWNRGLTGADHWMVCHSSREPGTSFGLALHPVAGREPFDEPARATFRLLFEHFERAQWLATRPPSIEGSDEALLIIDPRGRIVAASAAADAVLRADDGLTTADRVLTTSDPRHARRLARTVESALNAVSRGGVGGELLVERPSGLRPLALVIDPLPDQVELASFARGAIVRIVDPETPASPAAVARWRALWALTPAETRAAAALVSHGFDLRAAAASLGIRYPTMRTQLAAIYAKTATGSQPELMRLLTRVAG